MPSYHVHLSYGSKGRQGGGAPGFQRYLARLDLAEGFRRYLHREAGHGKDDLVAYGEANLPAWARDGAHFWTEAEQRERAKGPVFWHLQIALPRELGPEERRELAEDLREVMVGRYPHVWAIHEPQAQDGSGFQPHIHIQFSSRREDVESYKSVEEWFKRAPRGVPKDTSWRLKARLYEVREAVALMTNAALARAGVSAAVSAQSLEARGLQRPRAIYGSRTKERVKEYRQQLRDDGTLAREQLEAYKGWQQQAQKLLSLDRHYILDLCRDHVWRFDHSPTRQQERDASMQRAFALAARQVKRTMRPAPQRQTPTVIAAQHRQRMAAIRARQQEEPQAGSALHIRLFEDENERQRQRQQGMSW
jgi:hypothetical protein